MIHEPRCWEFCSAWVRRCARLLKVSIRLSRAELSKSQVFRLKEPSSKGRRCHDLLTNYRFCLLQVPWQTAGQLFARQENYALKKLIALRQSRTICAPWARKWQSSMMASKFLGQPPYTVHRWRASVI